MNITPKKAPTQRHRFTLIYSHGNAEDVGLSLPYLDYLSHFCDCHVLAYEYCGYSIAEGDASEQNCYECIQAAYDYLVRDCSIPPSQVILFGRSLGTGPTIDLAAKLCDGTEGDAGTRDDRIAACILQSPLESAGRCVLGTMASYMLYPLDIFRSYEKITKLAPIPVLIMHGTEDRVVPIGNGKALYKALSRTRKERYGTKRDMVVTNETIASLRFLPLWIPDVGHNDMPEFECMQAVCKFLDFVRARQKGTAT